VFALAVHLNPDSLKTERDERMEIASLIDHTLLRPDCTSSDVQQLCQEAIDYHFCAVCIPPFFVPNAVTALRGTPVKVATVIGFPMGYATTPAKVEEIKRAINDGVDELDVVVNLCAVKEGNWNYVKSDIDSIVTTGHLKSKVVKVIVETALLNDDEIEKICKICAETGVDFVKTSTGYNGPGASVDAVATLRKLLPQHIKIKASGGIRNKEAARKMIEAGANRIGSSTSISLVK
jgi:deoxyribose-phosphate aldolase